MLSEPDDKGVVEVVGKVCREARRSGVDVSDVVNTAIRLLFDHERDLEGFPSQTRFGVENLMNHEQLLRKLGFSSPCSFRLRPPLV